MMVLVPALPLALALVGGPPRFQTERVQKTNPGVRQVPPWDLYKLQDV